MKKNARIFKVEDIDAEIIVEFAKNPKEVFGWLDEYVENLQYDWFFASDEYFDILYDDGTEDRIDEEYDGHKIRRQHIASMLYQNPCTYIVYGNFEMNEYGVCYTAFEEKIAEENITEIKKA